MWYSRTDNCSIYYRYIYIPTRVIRNVLCAVTVRRRTKEKQIITIGKETTKYNENRLLINNILQRITKNMVYII